MITDIGGFVRMMEASADAVENIIEETTRLPLVFKKNIRMKKNIFILKEYVASARRTAGDIKKGFN